MGNAPLSIQSVPFQILFRGGNASHDRLFTFDLLPRWIDWTRGSSRLEFLTASRGHQGVYMTERAGKARYKYYCKLL